MLPTPDNKITVEGFKGLYSRGREDTCPQDHLSSCQNCEFPGTNQVKTRNGLALIQALGSTCVQFFQVFVSGAPRDFLVMDSAGRLWNSSSNYLSTFTGADGFVAINLYGRVYLCPTYLGGGLTGEFVYHYNGTALTKAAGAAFLATLVTSVDQTTAGIIDAGVHQLSFVKVYKTGYVSPPSPLYSVTAPGNKRIDLVLSDPGSNSLIDYVLILMTKANEEELFFVPQSLGGKIAYRAATATINCADTDLVSSADYLNDILPAIPSCAALRFYKGRLVAVSPNTDPQKVYVSRVQEPESFNSVTGVIALPPDASGNTPRTAYEIRDSLYLAKFTGVWSTQDNGGDPSTWPLSVVDLGYGCYDKGVSCFTSGLPASDVMEQALIAHKSGLLVFNGSFNNVPLSWKIQTIWDTINVNVFDKVTVAHDIWNKQIYVAVPLNAETVPSTVLLMDYKDGLDPASVKWSVWTFQIAPTFIAMCLLAGSGYKLHIGCKTDTNLFGVTSGQLTDNGTSITSYVKLPPVSSKPGWVSVYSALRFRMVGNGKVTLKVESEDNSVYITPPGFTMAVAPGKDYFRQINFTNEQLQLTLYSDTATVNSWFHLMRAEIFGVPVWMGYPA